MDGSRPCARCRGILLRTAALAVLFSFIILPPNSFAAVGALKTSPPATQQSPTGKSNVQPTDEPGSQSIPINILQTSAEGSVVDPNLGSDPGAFTYQYPFTISPGRNSMTPSLSLSYSSNNHEDTGFGYGWSLSIPYIERYNKTGEDSFYSTTTPANFFYSSLSGELVASSSANHYLARNDDGSFLQYTFSGNSWIVTDKSGNTYLFGAATTTRQDDPTGTGNTFKWMLQQETDPNGNYVSYSYTKDTGQIYPAAIYYTGSLTGVAPIFSILFTLSSNPDASATSSATGFPVRTKYRVSQISLQVSSSTISSYALNYISGDNGTRSLLNSITQSGINSSGTTTLPATLFGYATSTPTMATSTYSNPVGYFANGNGSLGVDVADINGDGLADLVQAYEDSSGVTHSFVYLNTGNGWSSATSTYTPPCLFGTYITTPGYHSYQDDGGRIADVNGDGLPDFVCGTTVYINNGTNWVASSTWNLPVSTTMTDSFGNSDDGGVRFADINGDGLLDLIQAHQYSYDFTNMWEDNVYINTGSGWRYDPTWVLPYHFMFTDENGNDGGGRALDVNGDGLSDLYPGFDPYITMTYTATTTAFINNGHGWTQDATWALPSSIDITKPWITTYDVNSDGLPDITYTNAELTDPSNASSFEWINNQTYTNTGSGWATSTYQMPISSYVYATSTEGLNSETSLHSANISGNGLSDLIACANVQYTSYCYTMLAQGSQPDLLTHIFESAGKSISIAYKATSAYMNVSGTLLNPKLPFYFPTVQSISYNDGITPTTTESYVYNNGTFYFASTTDRRFAGFGSITKTDESGNVSINYYHTGNGTATSTGEYSDNQSKIGKIYRTEEYDGAGNLFKVVITKWDGLVNGLANFVWPDQITELDYDGLTTHNDLATSYTYSTTTGDVLQQTSWGQVAANNDGSFTDTGTDERITNYTYAASSTIPFEQVDSKTTYGQSSNLLSEVKNYFDNLAFGSIAAGNVTETDSYKTSTTTVKSDRKAYNVYGLVTQEITALNATTTYSYDPYYLYPATTTNALGQSTTYTYNYAIGKPTQTKDPNGLITQTLYDALNRISAILKPDPLATSTLATTTAFAYVTSSYPQSTQETEYLNAATTTNKYTYTDGFGRTVEERDPTATSGTYAVSDTYYNGLGLVASKSLPYFGTGTGYTGISLPPVNPLLTTYTYDALQRLLTTTNAVGSTINTYGNWRVTTKDPNGNLKDYYKDAYGNLITIVEHLATTTATTSYAYDGNNNLVLLVDALGNVRNFTYDLLGRRLTSQDLHASGDSSFGTWSYMYDDDGNLTQQTDPKSQVVNYTYDILGRVLTEDYTGATGTEQMYTYDTCTDGIGHLCIASSTSSVTSYLYDLLGNTIKETDTIATSSYVTQHTYDRLGNVTGITYPDDSQVQYLYNIGNLLQAVNQKEAGASTWNSIESGLTYSPMNQVTGKTFGNGVTTTYTYDASNLYRLTHIHTVSAGGAGILVQTGGGGTGVADDDSPDDSPDTSAPPADASSTQSVATSTDVYQTLENALLSTYADDEIDSSTPLTIDSSTPPTVSSTTPADILPVATSTGADSDADSTSTVDQQESFEDDTISTTTATSTPQGDGYAEYLESLPPDSPTLQLKANPSDILGEMQLPNGLVEYAYNTHQSIENMPASQTTLASAQAQGLTITGEVPGMRTSHARVFATNQPHTYISEIIGGNPHYYEDDSGEWWLAEYGLTTQAAFEAQTSQQSIFKKILSFFDPKYAYAGSSSFYPGAGGYNYAFDGWLSINNQTDWPDTINASSANDQDSSASYMDAQDYLDDSYCPNCFYLQRPEILFDTSSLSSYGNLIGATLGLYVLSSDITGPSTELDVVTTDPHSYYSPYDSDFGTFGSTSFGAYTGTYTNNAFSTITLNSAGLAAIATTSVTSFGLRTYDDFHDVAPTASTSYDVQLATSEAGDAESPVLTVTYSYIPTSPTNLLTDALSNPTGLGDHDPSFSATFNSPNGPTDYATAYEIQVSTSSTNWSTPYWDSGEATSTSSTTQGSQMSPVTYAGTALQSLLTYFWRIRFWDSYKNEGAWSTQTASFALSQYYNPNAPTNLEVNGATNPANLSTTSIQFTSLFTSSVATDTANAYEIQVSATSSSFSDTIWDSGETLFGTPIQEGSTTSPVSYGGTSLIPGLTYYWRMRFWTNHSLVGSWSTTTASFELTNSLSPGDLQDIYYTYDNDGNITGIYDHSGTGAAKFETFTYDALNRLTSASTTMASSSPFSQFYNYGLTGNLTYKSDVGSYVYSQTGDDDPDAPTTVGTSTLVYDNNGNLTNYGPSTYTWDYRNELTSVGNGVSTSTYGYDYESNRDRKTVSGVTTNYPNNLYSIAGNYIVRNVYDTSGNLLSTTQGGGSASTSTSTPTLFSNATSSSNGYNAGPVTKTWTHNVGTGINRILVLTSSIWQDVAGTGTIASATYNGIPLTSAVGSNNDGIACEIWYLINPPTGPHTLSVTITGATDTIKLDSSDYTGISQTTPVNTTAKSKGSSGNPMISVIAGNSKDLIVDDFARYNTVDANTSRTPLYNDYTGSMGGAADYYTTTATGTSMDTYTGPDSDNWCMNAVAFTPALTGGAATTTTYVHPDILGSTNVTTDTSGNLAQTLDYYPFGSTRLNTGSPSQARTYIGQQYDAESSLLYLNARYMNPLQGQFLSEDPVALSVGNSSQVKQLTNQDQSIYLTDPQALNFYSYARDNPITSKDPSGKDYLEFNGEVNAGSLSGDLGIRVDLRNLRLDAGYGAGGSKGESASFTGFYSSDDLPSDHNYLVQSADVTGALDVAGRVSVSNTQSLQGGPQLQLSGGSQVGLGVGEGASVAANISQYTTIVDYSQGYSIFNKLSNEVAQLSKQVTSYIAGLNSTKNTTNK